MTTVLLPLLLAAAAYVTHVRSLNFWLFGKKGEGEVCLTSFPILLVDRPLASFFFSLLFFSLFLSTFFVKGDNNFVASS